MVLDNYEQSFRVKESRVAKEKDLEWEAMVGDDPKATWILALQHWEACLLVVAVACEAFAVAVVRVAEAYYRHYS